MNEYNETFYYEIFGYSPLVVLHVNVPEDIN